MNGSRAWLVFACMLLGMIACVRDGAPERTPPRVWKTREERFSRAGMLVEATSYIDDAAFRRDALVASLANPDNTYGRARLASYGLQNAGWDLLPEYNPRSAPLTRDAVARIRRGEAPGMPDDAAPIWDGKRPTSVEAWIALGEKVFFGYPMRAEVFLQWAVTNPEVGEAVGVLSTAAGVYPGSVLFVDDTGQTAVGLTCAQCHSRVRDGVVHPGEARRDFDYGKLRIAYHAATHEPVDAELVRRMARWGAGRADVTEDENEDPVAIPDLWGLREQTALTQAGTLRQIGPAVLAIRQETQLVQTNHERVRPPRVVAFALAMYLYSLAPSPPAPSATPQGAPNAEPNAQSVEQGRYLFAHACAGCHDNAAFGGEPVLASEVATDPLLATGRARGTGRYRPPALLNVRDAAPYFHHGAVPSLGDLLGRARFEAAYDGPLGRGAVPGHDYGTRLPDGERDALIAYLRTL